MLKYYIILIFVLHLIIIVVINIVINILIIIETLTLMIIMIIIVINILVIINSDSYDFHDLNFTSILRRNWKQSGVGSGPRALSSIIKIGIISIFCIFASRFLEIASLHIPLYQTDLRVTLVREKLRKILSTVGQVIGKSDSHSWSLLSLYSLEF